MIVVFLLFLMFGLCLLESISEAVARFIRWVCLPRYRWNRGGRFTFN